MATKCIDISDNKRLGTTSPISVFAFIAMFIIIVALTEPSLMQVILILLALVISQVFFQYKPRFIFLTIRYIFKNGYLTPTCEDKHFYLDDLSIKSVREALSDYEIAQIEEKRQQYAKKYRKT